jgi:hypothetical protein
LPADIGNSLGEPVVEERKISILPNLRRRSSADGGQANSDDDHAPTTSAASPQRTLLFDPDEVAASPFTVMSDSHDSVSWVDLGFCVCLMFEKSCSPGKTCCERSSSWLIPTSNSLTTGACWPARGKRILPTLLPSGSSTRPVLRVIVALQCCHCVLTKVYHLQVSII